MKKIINRLRNQPEEHRRGVLHLIIGICGLVLLVLWTYSFGTSLPNDVAQEEVKEELQPFSILKSNIIDGYKSISEPDLE